MTLRPGDAWGTPGLVPSDLVVARSDTEAVELIEVGHRVIGLAGGDLCRTLGGHGDIADRRGGEGTLCPIDIGRADMNGRSHRFLAHVIARGPLWRGEAASIMNAEWYGDYRLGPRAHPGDGLLDITTGRLALNELPEARSRSRTGDHLPHPRLRLRRTGEATLDFPRPRTVWLDGVKIGRTRGLHVSVEPNAATVMV